MWQMTDMARRLCWCDTELQRRWWISDTEPPTTSPTKSGPPTPSKFPPLGGN
jgi:hypothetical protein